MGRLKDYTSDINDSSRTNPNVTSDGHWPNVTKRFKKSTKEDPSIHNKCSMSDLDLQLSKLEAVQCCVCSG